MVCDLSQRPTPQMRVPNAKGHMDFNSASPWPPNTLSEFRKLRVRSGLFFFECREDKSKRARTVHRKVATMLSMAYLGRTANAPANPRAPTVQSGIQTFQAGDVLNNRTIAAF